MWKKVQIEKKDQKNFHSAVDREWFSHDNYYYYIGIFLNYELTIPENDNVHLMFIVK